jgi:hypothetical protein
MANRLQTRAVSGRLEPDEIWYSMVVVNGEFYATAKSPGSRSRQLQVLCIAWQIYQQSTPSGWVTGWSITVIFFGNLAPFPSFPEVRAFTVDAQWKFRYGTLDSLRWLGVATATGSMCSVIGCAWQSDSW